ncbi:MAG: hypothetical protein IVW57_17905 [Ktedonobacterales bacterium]|nr:hypothetical protein [Ktedonobacterales bacterium]
MVADPPLLTTYRPETPPSVQEVILLALRREVTERYEHAAELAQALRWSRHRSPEPPPVEPGTWVMGERPVPPLRPAPSPPPALDGAAPGIGESATQSTVLRVAPIAPPDADTHTPSLPRSAARA